MKNYVHARLGPEERVILKELRETTGAGESALVKRGLRFIYEQEVRKAKSALDVAGKSVGKFRSRIGDLSVNKKHLQGYGR